MPRIELSPKQSKFVLSRARYVGFIGGIGSGKTAAGAVKALRKTDEGEPGIVVAPDFPHFSKSTWPEWSRWIPWGRVENRHLNHPYTQDKRLLFRTQHGVVPVYYGGIDEPDSWTGPTVNWCWFDESRRKDDRKAFDILCGRARIGNDPQVFTTTSPAGKHHWLYDVFVKKIIPKEIADLFASHGAVLCEYVQAHTKENEANLDPLYLASLMSIYTGRYAEQELAGQFVVFEGAVYESFGDTNVTKEAEYIPGVPIEYGVDDGFTANHPRVFLLSQEIPPFINFFAEYIVTYELPEVSIAHLKELEYPLGRVAYIDSSAAELAARLWDEGIDTVASTHSVPEGIKHVRPFICDADGVRRVRFHPRCEFSVDEIKSYAYPARLSVRAGSGQPNPAKISDNAADAMRYLLWNKSIPELDELAEKSVHYEATGEPTPEPPFQDLFGLVLGRTRSQPKEAAQNRERVFG